MRRFRVVLLVLSFLAGTGHEAIAQQQLWSNPATWGGRVPGPGEHVLVPQGRHIVLDVSPPPLGSITVDGVLSFAEKDIDLTLGWMMVHGRLEIGTEQVPFEHHVTITLNGPLGDDIMGMGARFIGAMHGGVLEIHGARREDVDWAVLNAHARPGDTTISLALVEPNKGELGWQPGDRIVLAPSGRDPLQAEAVTVTSVSGTQVSFTPALQYFHWGTLQTAGGRIVDERAEVGLLSRNIVISGAPDGWTQRLGGHIMIMTASVGKIEGVELHHMGQQGRKGRYPIHWHHTGPVFSDYARFNSIWTSFHRAIAIHRTRGVEVRGNVAADIWSHTYVVAEEGSETENIVEDNLGILTKRLPDEGFAFARYGEPGSLGSDGQDEWRPATFWINNANNVVRRNRAAGGLDAVGFFYDDDHGRAAPADRSAVDFSGNVAHSYLSSNPQADLVADYSSGAGLLVRMAPRPAGVVSFADFTAYHNSVAGAWLDDRGDVLQDPILADNASGAVVRRASVDGGLIVGQTANTVTAHPPNTIRGGIRVTAGEGPSGPQVRRTTFVNQAPAAVYVESDHVIPGNLFEQITRIDTPVPVFLRDRTADHRWEGGVLDADGSLTGAGVRSLVTGRPLAADSVFMPGWGTFNGGAYLSPQTGVSGPSGLASSVDGSTVFLAWYPPSDSTAAATYVLEAGSGPGRTDLLQMNIGSDTLQSFPNVAPGRYFVRVRGAGRQGLTPASNEVQVVVGETTCYVPDPPSSLSYGVSGNLVSLQWNPSALAESYLLGVGRSSGAFDLLVRAIPGGQTTLNAEAAAGTYFVQMAGVNGCGLSGLSNEIIITVP